jgi:hypothetical protein
VEHPVLNEAMIEIEMSMAIGEFPEWLYARTYMDILKLSRYLSAGNGDKSGLLGH